MNIKNYLGSISGVVIGAIGGYLYYHFVGCANGQCTIQSSWYLMTIYGSLLGLLLLSNFDRKKKKSQI